jgi:hypothetical protein
MKPPGIMSSIFWGLIAFAVILVTIGVLRSQEKVAKPRYDYSPRPAAVIGALSSPQPFFDFGELSMAAGKVSHRFGIMNTGDSSITVNRVYTSCMCTEATLVTLAGKKGPFGMPGHGRFPAIFETIPPGGGAQVDVVFDPAAHGPAGVGPTDRTVIIRSNESPPLELRFTAMVKP